MIVDAATSDGETCGERFSGVDERATQLYCLKPPGHSGDHVTCLGYHPDHDVWEWARWHPDDPERIIVETTP